MTKKIRQILPYLGILLGLGILVYFPAADYIEEKKMEEVIASIEPDPQQDDMAALDSLLDNALAYNEMLAGLEPSIPADRILPYEKQLLTDPQREGAPFGSVIIPKIDVYLPLYHTSGNNVLAAGAGHLEGTSLPVGGRSSHSSVSAHSGMQNQAAFDNIRQLKKGDVFGYRILGRLFCYEVDSIETVDPDQVDKLSVIENEDRSTLITCTPYGVNTSRLLVSGHRVEVPEGFAEEKPSIPVMVQDRRNLGLLIGLGILLFLMMVLAWRMISRKMKRKTAERNIKKNSRDSKAEKKR